MKPRRAVLLVLAILVPGFLRAQDVTVLDGPALEIQDSLKLKPSPAPLPIPDILNPIFRPMNANPFGFETREQRAARINTEVHYNVMGSVDRSLYWYRPPLLSPYAKAALAVASLFLSNPFGFQEGYVPMGNASFQFVFAKTPGMAPYDNPYSPENFPQAVRLEYDAASGTYKQVMVDWTEFQKNMGKSAGWYNANSALPRIPLNSMEQHLF